MQSELIEQYNRLKVSINFPSELSERLSAPMCIYVPRQWEDSETRVLVVGQEPMGWGFEAGGYYDWPYEPISSWRDFNRVQDSVPAMIHGYKSFEFSRHQVNNYRSPFWRAYRQVREAVGDEKDGLQTSVLWTNLFRASIDGGSVLSCNDDDLGKILEASRDVLLSELKILRPTSVIFFTGPTYNESLYSSFPDICVSSFNERDPEKTARISHANLPVKAWRTYHPSYLVRSNQWDVVDDIVHELRKERR